MAFSKARMGEVERHHTVKLLRIPATGGTEVDASVSLHGKRPDCH